MPFRPELDIVYATIREACDDSGVQCLRADEIFNPGPILTQILGRIARSRFIVADLTGSNPNVFYELGIAQVVKRNVILLAQNADEVPFDLRHLRQVIYRVDNLEYLKTQLIACIRTLTDEPPVNLALPPRQALSLLAGRNLADPSDALFGQNDETARLSMRRRDCSSEPGEPATSFAVFSAVPSQDSILRIEPQELRGWFDPNQRRYDPDRGRLFIPIDGRRPQVDGAIAYETSGGPNETELWTRYLLLKYSGYVEYGGRFAYCHSNEVYFALTPMISYLASFIRFVQDLYQLGRCETGFFPYITLVGTKNSQLSHLAKGWREPFGQADPFVSRCALPHLQLAGEEIKPSSELPEVLTSIRRMASTIDHAYGVWETRAFNHPNAGDPDALSDSGTSMP
jgi:hypothetical protein